MENGQIHIFIGKGQSGELNAKDQVQLQMENKDVEGNNLERQAIATALIQSGKQAISQGINIYTQITGDTTTSEAINMIANVSADALTIAKGGWVGAIAVGTKYALQACSSIAENYIKNRQLEYNNKMLGDISLKGSRYWQ